jgi:GTP cyclohydrolase II
MERKLTSSGSDICTCRPYLIYGIEEAVKCAQRGGVGLIVYFRKEGRALGEVTKCKLFFQTLLKQPPQVTQHPLVIVVLSLIADLVYNSRKRGGDSADRYFKATEMIAGVKDMRFQAIMPDTLHWLGVQKIDNMISMVCPCLNTY